MVVFQLQYLCLKTGFYFGDFFLHSVIIKPWSQIKTDIPWFIHRRVNCVYKVWVQKIYPPSKVFWQFFSNDWEFLNKMLHAYCLFISMQNYKTLLNYFTQTLAKICHIKRDRLVNFYISLEKCEKLRYICNSMTYLQKCDTTIQNVFFKCTSR